MIDLWTVAAIVACLLAWDGWRRYLAVRAEKLRAEAKDEFEQRVKSLEEAEQKAKHWRQDVAQRLGVHEVASSAGIKGPTRMKVRR